MIIVVKLDLVSSIIIENKLHILKLIFIFKVELI